MIQKLLLNANAMLLISNHAIFVKRNMKKRKSEFRRYIESDVGGQIDVRGR